MPEPQVSSPHGRFIEELLAIKREHSVRDPIFDAVRTGSMSRSGVKLWTLQASLVVRQFTRFISAIHANCPYRDAQQLLAKNLWEEHGEGVRSQDHYLLIRKLAHSLGASDRDLDDASPLKETTEYIAHCLKVTRELSFVESIAAIAVGVESFMPTFFGRLAESLCSNYGLTRDDVEYLLVHVEFDDAHQRRALTLLDAYADSKEIQHKAKQALRDMLLVKQRFAAAVYTHCSAAS
jgi:pyrroloquinoline quinone (PQQ) biosynthesis protein C